MVVGSTGSLHKFDVREIKKRAKRISYDFGYVYKKI
jgi:hypothetical protein